MCVCAADRRARSTFAGVSHGGPQRLNKWEWDLNPGTHGHVYTRESTRVCCYSFSVTHRFLARLSHTHKPHIQLQILSQPSAGIHQEMWLRSFLLTVLMAKCAVSIPEPGLLRVPKVYNAVITSNQKLAPSRAYPVIQPIVHRTAIGYVPPFYYTQIAPGFAGPGVVQLEPGQPSRPDDAESVETPTSASNPPPKRISSPTTRKNENDDSSGENFSSESSEQSSSSSPDSRSDGEKSKKGKNNDRVPLSFYPNYRSVYYDPYFYPYNAFPPQFATPGTYYVDYPQPPGILGPLLPPLPLQPGPGAFPIPTGRPDEGNDQELPSRSERQKIRKSERRETIPDVPAPPLPISIGKKAS